MSSSMKPWKIIPRPILQTVLNNHVQHHRVPQPLFLHGPRGVGKTSLILHRLLDDWNKGAHVTGYVDFAATSSLSPPWTSWTTSPPSTSTSLSSLQNQLEQCLERMIEKGISLGAIGSQQVFQTLNKWHGINTALRRIIQNNQTNSVIVRTVDGKKDSAAVLWSRAVYAMATRSKTEEIDRVLGLNERGRALTVEERSYFREAMLGVRLAKEVIGMHRKWKANAVAELNRTGGFSRPLANSATDWAYLLVELLSNAAEVDHFQPKLVINNIELLRHAISTDDSMVSASMYHDSFLWRLVALGMNERSLPVIFVTSDSYYSYRVTYDFGYPEIFVSRETFGWTPQEAKIHMVDDYFSESEWKVIIEVLGSNPRHLSELYALKQSTQCQKIMLDISGSAFDDIVEAYLAYLQVTVVNPAMERVLSILQKFAVDAYNGKIPKDQLQFGAPWRRPPRTDNPDLCSEWAKVQLMDFVRSLVKTEFGLNYFADYSLEIFDDPAATAMVEVGLLYTQRDPSFIRPVSQGIEKCLMRWFIQERMQMGFLQSFRYLWQRVIRGRSYRHLMKEIGYK